MPRRLQTHGPQCMGPSLGWSNSAWMDTYLPTNRQISTIDAPTEYAAQVEWQWSQSGSVKRKTGGP